MTSTKKPQNGLVESLTADTLCNVIDSLLFVNDYFLQMSESDMPPEKEVFYGLGRHLDQSIAALRYEKKKMAQKLNKAGRQRNARIAERALRALKNPVMENSEKHTDSRLIELIRDSFNDLQNAQSEYYRAVESTGKETVIRDKDLPVFTEWMVERSDHIFHAIEVLGDRIRKQERTYDEQSC